jgi:probable rRNA maturation factor
MTQIRVHTDVVVNHARWRRARVTALCRRAAQAALRAGVDRLPLRHALRRRPRTVELSLLLASDARLRALNRRHRGQDKPTNVLSFPAFARDDVPAEGPVHLGDVAVAFETARREARSEGKDLTAHTAHLVVHGVLHLLGYDHAVERDARMMERLERRALKDLGFADPYAGTTPVCPPPPKPRSRTRARAR